MGSVHTFKPQDLGRDQATQAQIREFENFVAFAAHDLRAPIGQMQSLVTLLRQDFVDMGDGKIEVLGHLADVVETSFQVLTDVLDYAQTAQDAMPPEVFELGPLCETQRRMLDRQNRLSLSYPQMRLKADRISLGIVLRNLIDNALRYAGRAHVSVDIDPRQLGPGMLQITVTDDGTGFSDPATAFDWRPGERRTGGYGLRGLKRLLDARGGGIAALPPRQGQGAHIVLQFPGVIL